MAEWPEPQTVDNVISCLAFANCLHSWLDPTWLEHEQPLKPLWKKEAKFKVGRDATGMSLGFRVSDVQKPLAAVWRIVDKGNVVQFGPREEDNFIQNIMTKKKIPLVRKGGS